MFTFEFAHRLFSGPSEQVPAMNRVKSLIRAQNFSGTVFPFSKGYAAWETDEVTIPMYSQILSKIKFGCLVAHGSAERSRFLANHCDVVNFNFNLLPAKAMVVGCLSSNPFQGCS